MPFNSEHYLHPDDSSALEALKAIPGFSTLMKGFMKEFSERSVKLRCLSSYIRLGEDQLPRYREMLVPICEKLGIEVPELYLMMDVRPNAFTTGENKAFIVLTSGLLDALPDRLIPTVLAHECGHIACHHVLYRTMGNILFSIVGGSLNMIPFGGLITIPLQMAFYHWMRCSEYSADRAAVLCDGSAAPTAELCMRLAGFDMGIKGEMNMDAFLRQAQEYRELVKEDSGNRSMETMLLMNASHPFSALRALEAIEWSATKQYEQIVAGTYVPEPKAAETAQKSVFDFSLDDFFKGLDPKKETPQKKTEKKICPACGTENGADAMFCMHCGTPLTPKKNVCPSCGEELQGNESFCPKCGTKIEK